MTAESSFPRRAVADEEWGALRDAASGFAARWQAYRRSDEYRPGDTWGHLRELALFVDDRLQRGDEGPLLGVIEAFEAVYAPADDDLEGYLRVGLLEDVMAFGEERGVDLVRLFLRLGPAGRLAWDAAYRYTHHGKEWEPPAAALHPHQPKRSGGRKRKRGR